MYAGHRERWQPGDSAFFEYHCTQAHDSDHAQWWYRSHQHVVVLALVTDDPGEWTMDDRSECGEPLVYRVRWGDGSEGDVFEDELLRARRYRDPDGYFCPPPDWRERLAVMCS